MIKRKTAKKRFTRGLKAIAAWCRENRHWRIAEQQATLTAKLRGHYQYYGLRGNYDSLSRFLRIAEWLWKRSLERRSQRGRLSWEHVKAAFRGQLLPQPTLRADAGT